MATEEESPFLDSTESNGKRNRYSLLESLDCNRSRSLGILAAIGFLLLIICVILMIWTISLWKLSAAHICGSSTTNGVIKDPYSPANSVIEYEYRLMYENDTRFTGHPGPEWERSMHQLMDGTLLRISDAELQLLDTNSIPFKNGGYAAGLGIAHNLHCVKKIKQFIYREYFYPDLDAAESEFEYTQSHADHCLDFLRQSVMCHIDYTMYTLYWGERQQDIPTHKMPGAQKCVNWNKLHEWMIERSENTDMLVRPRV
ncbi:hypothetical protein F4679DRAFT_566704 [Xylaria curta]|nr:hypothetical protein F4679DRAFT_566704 [Xylaria curta]